MRLVDIVTGAAGALLAAALCACGSPDGVATPRGAHEVSSGALTRDAGDVDGSGQDDGGGHDDGGAAREDAGTPGDAGDTSEPGDTSDAGVVAPLPFTPAPRFVPDGPLCTIAPDHVALGGDPTFIDCGIAVDHLAPALAGPAPATIRVVAWNVEFGVDNAGVLAALQGNDALRTADVLLLSEVARHNLQSAPQGIDQARDLATALGMNYAFAVEWDRRENPAELGEHGVAVLSRFPLGNLAAVRHTPLNDWYAEDHLYGGRVSLGADVQVGSHVVRVYVSHLCTRPQVPTDDGRAVQAAETRRDALLPGRTPLVVVGGDLNTWTCNPATGDCTVAPRAEQAVQDFLAQGWQDGTAGWNGATQLGIGFFPQRLDWIFTRGVTVTPGAAVTDAGASDHRPIWTDVTLP